MKTAKLGAIFLISIMALAGVGAGYAAWFDTITIQGTVNTGSVGWDVTGYSGTWVWKVYGCGAAPDDECVITTTSTPPVYDGCTVELISYSYAEQTEGDGDSGPVDDSVSVVFHNLFPCINFEADFWITYTGSVPGKINDITFTDLWPEGEDEIYIDWFTDLEITIYDENDNEIDVITNPYILDGYQLHYGYKIHVVMIIHLPQYYDWNNDNVDEPTDYLMDLTGSFGLDVEVVQWNEYPYTH